MNKFLQKINNYFFHDKSPKDLLNYEDSVLFLESLRKKNNNNYIYRSFNQYLAYKKIHDNKKILILNIVSFFVMPFVVVLYLLKNIFDANPENKTTHAKKIAYSITNLKLNVIPESLKKEYIIINNSINSSLKIKDFSYLFLLFRKFSFNFFFILRNIIHLANYSSIIKQTKCNAIITNSEYSFSSSFLTKYCEDNNVLHINVMHGEKLFYIRDSFFAFHKFYVWDNYYIDLFKSLKAKPDQFVVELPDVLTKFSHNLCSGGRFLYYLQGMETIKEINIIHEHVVNNFGVKPVFRLHPRYSKKELINKNSNIIFENPIDVDFDTSFSSTKYVCTKYSTLLFQAYLANKIIIIDDLSDPELYKKLENLKYIMLNKNYIRLSDLNIKMQL
ncbi:MAG: hypothetical protein JXR68_10460 [Bacteroidales bacterium]|nr:hypothetical protein [Bacteroidales bacterium]